ncbi:ABC transporter substrate-binding protein [Paenibacillus thermotolerans]|uniref:ABC transporter substrate-binding protein n=1 Tax=Paenibacillus thermotolerans TaxID=3027807 RepID=UPI002368609A|nr:MULTISPECIES: ABC transporter substrate-binding protein [unclassified Paenibacillus]
MSKLKKGLVASLTLMLSASLVLSACGSKAGDKTAAGGEGTSEKPVELIWYTIGTPQKDTDKVMAEVSKYTKEKIGVTVKMNQIDWGDYNQKMQVMAASGEPMDIMFTASWAFNYVENARKGAFYPIDDLLKEEGKGIVETLDPAFLEGSKVDGKNYGVPANKELPAQEVWRFNKQLLDKYNLDISNVYSMESLEPLMKTIKEKEPNVTPFAVDKNFKPYVPYDYLIENMPMAVKVGTDDYKVVNILETPEMKQALDTMHKYYQAGYIPTEAATMNSLSDLQSAGTWFTDRAATQPFADNLWSQSYGYPVVSTPASESIIYNWSVMGSMQAISANSEHPKEAMKFLNLLNTDPYLRNLVDSGIEGVHYKKIGDNVMENLPESKNYDMPTFSLGNIMITYLNPSDPETKWDEFKKFNEAGKPAPLLGFNFDTSKVTTQIAAVQNVQQEFWAPLMTGTVDPNVYLPKAIEKFKAAGLDKIIEEAQRQVDEWRASQN